MVTGNSDGEMSDALEAFGTRSNFSDKLEVGQAM